MTSRRKSGPARSALNDTQQRVQDILAAASGPLSAYEVLDRMRVHGAVTPPTIYRSLDRLIEIGLAHRLESLNAYVACSHPHPHEMAAFAICERCGSVTEFSDPQIDKRLSGWATAHAFKPKKITIEMRGLCEACAA
jgi:Fur family transcriptional regulator, zinc uptake regulator